MYDASRRNAYDAEGLLFRRVTPQLAQIAEAKERRSTFAYADAANGDRWNLNVVTHCCFIQRDM